MVARDKDPYLYEDSNVLINKEDIRDDDALKSFERIMTAQRMAEGFPNVPLTVGGFTRLHLHLFQDVYEWAGKVRIVDIAKGNHLFCRAVYVAPELDKRFAKLKSENGLKSLSATKFSERAGEHIAELNAIHPFREGNGRAMRAFLKVLGEHAGHEISLRNIDPDTWNEASRVSFRTGDTALMREVIAAAIIGKK